MAGEQEAIDPSCGCWRDGVSPRQNGLEDGWTSQGFC
uniref:Transmembrane protein 208 n=1 Tax=Homo sapiens TaxID=9606 RepID=J3QRY9_HUMAN